MHHLYALRLAAAGILCIAWGMHASAAAAVPDPCARPPVGSSIASPVDLRAQDGVLRVNFHVRNHREADGSVRFCYVLDDGTQSPTLRLHPGDLLILNLKNELDDLKSAAHTHHPVGAPAAVIHARAARCT